MAGDWIKWCKGLAWKPEVLHMAKLLNKSRNEVAAMCMIVWEWVDENSSDGCNAPSVTLALLDERTGVTGFGAAMAETGWVTQTGSGLYFKNGDRHNGQTAKRRALTKSRVEKSRGLSAPICNAPSVTKSLPEKRREDKKEMSTSPPPTPQGADGGGGGMGECPFDGEEVQADPMAVLTPDGISAVNGWLGAASWSSHHATYIAQMVKDHGLAKVVEAIAITAEAGSRSMNYLEAVLKNGCKRKPASKGRRIETGSEALARALGELKEQAEDVF